MPIQTAAPPIPTPALRTVQSLPEPGVQSQERTQPQHHSPAPQTIVQPTPTYITQPARPKPEHRPISTYPDPFQRPQPRPPDVKKVKDTRKDLMDLDMNRTINIEENSPYQEGVISEMYERPDKSQFKNLQN